MSSLHLTGLHLTSLYVTSLELGQREEVRGLVGRLLRGVSFLRQILHRLIKILGVLDTPGRVSDTPVGELDTPVRC